MNAYLQYVGKRLKKRKAILVLDRAAWHKSKGLVIPSNITIVYLPPYSPELNPVERLWQYIKNHVLKNKFYATLREVEKAVSKCIRQLNEASLRTICSANYLYS